MIPASPLGPIEAKIAWVRACNDRFGERLLNDIRVSAQIETLKAATEASFKEMTRSGVREMCRRCETEEGGSCCGAGLENRYDGWLLLINALLGVTIPAERWRKDACFFLGETGCRLRARHVICINYVCKKITDAFSPSRLEKLREREGEEIQTLFRLNESIKALLTKWTSG
ncbi:MAG: hypothetical protein U5R49_25760 [Deltaproteobacteria bacterium]|nr:hypothetical protein [Deltaproteobacteria bacterium]